MIASTAEKAEPPVSRDPEFLDAVVDHLSQEIKGHTRVTEQIPEIDFVVEVFDLKGKQVSSVQYLGDHAANQASEYAAQMEEKGYWVIK